MLNLRGINSKVKGAVNILGFSLSIFFLCLAIFSQRIDWPALISRAFSHWWIILFCVGLGLLGNLMLAYGWKNCLLGADVELSFPEALKIYGKSQIAKYLPGNIGHVAGRQILGKQAGISHKDLIYSQIIEILMLITLSTTIGALGIQGITNKGLAFKPTSLIYVCAAISFIVLLFFFVKASNKGKNALSFLCYFSFFVMNGIVLVTLFGMVSDGYGDVCLDHKAIFSSFSASWIIGFLTPGSPAGMGSREVFSLYYLRDLISTEIIVESLVLSRLGSMLSDILIFLIASSNLCVQQKKVI